MNFFFFLPPPTIKSVKEEKRNYRDMHQIALQEVWGNLPSFSDTDFYFALLNCSPIPSPPQLTWPTVHVRPADVAKPISSEISQYTYICRTTIRQVLPIRNLPIGD